MKKNIFILLFMLFLSQGIYSQLLVPTLSPDMIAYSGEGKYAIIVVLCHNSMKLEFSTNLDGPKGSLIKKKEEKEIGNQIEYTLTFDAEQAYNARLRIISPGYNALDILIDLKPNEAKKYIIDDPEYPESKPCHIKNMLYGDQYFLEASYSRSKEAYLQSLSCWVYTDGNDDSYIRERIQDIDSIAEYQRRGKSAENVLDYRNAADSYNKAYKLNPKDIALEEKKNESTRTYADFCLNCLTQAEKSFTDRDFVTAKTYYRKMIEQSCPESKLATNRIQYLEDRENYNYKVLTYEYAANAPIGISSGNYKERYNIRGYFTLRFNPKVFDAMRSDYEKAIKPEVNVSFGWTIMAYKPVWVFFGPGYTGIGEYVYEEDAKPNKDGEIKPKFKFHSALSPEIGVLGKIPIMGKDRIALRYTFQYRYSLKKEQEDMFGKTKHVFGIGFCF